MVNKKKRKNKMENQSIALAEDILEKYSTTLAKLTTIHGQLAEDHNLKQYFDDQHKIITDAFDDLQNYLKEVTLRKFTDNLLQ